MLTLQKKVERDVLIAFGAAQVFTLRRSVASARPPYPKQPCCKFPPRRFRIPQRDEDIAFHRFSSTTSCSPKNTFLIRGSKSPPNAVKRCQALFETTNKHQSTRIFLRPNLAFRETTRPPKTKPQSQTKHTANLTSNRTTQISSA